MYYILYIKIMQKYLHLLERLGMTKEEQQVYMVLLNHPYSSITEMARQSGYHRPAIYRAIASLESQWLIESSLLDGKRKYYHITSPLKLRERIDDLMYSATRLLPEMEAVYKKNHEAPILSVMEWVDGIQKIHDDIVSTLPMGWEYLCYSASREGEEKLGFYVSREYMKKTKTKELSRKLIVNTSEKMIDDGYRDIAMIPASFDVFDDDITKVVYGTKVAVIDYNSHTGWIIDNPQFAQYEEKLFRLLFRLLKKTK